MYLYNTKFNPDGLPALVKERQLSSSIDRIVCSDQLYTFSRDSLFLTDYTEEYMYTVCIDTKGRILGCFEISHGTVNASFSNPREIFMKLLLLGAVSFFLIHNHPSQDPTPSKEDCLVTKRMKKAGTLLGIPLLEHLIVCQNNYYSFEESDQEF